TGATSLDERFRTQPHRLSAEVRARASAISGDLWIERVKCTTSPRAANAAGISSDALSQLAERVRGATLTPEALDAAAHDLRKVTNKLPPEVRAVIDPSNPESLSSALPDATRFLAALLLDGGDADLALQPKNTTEESGSA
ncbi:MAG: hypothetical protein AAGG01_08515, partial [Planctomycetota bacterium]